MIPFHNEDRAWFMALSLVFVISFLILHLIRVRRLRYRRLEQIQSSYGHLSSDPRRMKLEAALEIAQVTSEWDCPFLVRQALAFALFQTYAVPAISTLLVKTGRLSSPSCVGKRAEDTVVIIKEIESFGPYHPRGALALARMNWIHSLYGKSIKPEDLLLTLCLFIFEPGRLVDRFEWRAMTELEKEARFVIWSEVGKHMGIANIIPETRQELWNWCEDYRRAAFVYDSANPPTAQATIDLFIRPLPPFLRPIVRQCLVVLVPDQVREAFGWPPARPAWLYTLIPLILAIRAFVTRHLMLPRQTPFDFGTRDPSNVSQADPSTVHYQRTTWLYEPLYVKATLSNQLLSLLLLRKTLDPSKFKTQGYAIESVGPEELAHQGHSKIRSEAERILNSRPVDLPLDELPLNPTSPVGIKDWLFE